MKPGEIAYRIRRIVYGQIKSATFAEEFGCQPQEVEDFLRMRYWVPCADEMPKPGRDCLVTLANGNITTGIWEYEKPGEWTILPGVPCPKLLQPVAWMYLPESYTAEQMRG